MGNKRDKGQGGQDEVRSRLIGLGEGSIRKSYYPQLREQIEELQQMHGYLASVLDAMPSAILRVDGDLTVTHGNRAAAVLAGVDPGDLPGMALADALPGIRRYLRGFRSAIRDERSLERRNTAVFTEEGTNHFDIMLSPIPGGRSAVVRVDDVTDRVRMDQVIVQTEKMVSLGGLAAGMAHEINNPLGGILQGAQNIRRRLLEDREANRKAAERAGLSFESLAEYVDDRGITRFLGGISESGERAAEIVRHMLNFSRSRSQERQEVNLEDVAEAALTLAARDFELDRKFGFRGVEVVREYQFDSPPVPMTPTEIEQVLFNIIKNAVEAMGEAGTKKPHLRLSTCADEKEAVIEIADNGPGMDEENKRRIFEPFFTTKAVGEGTGLGMSVSYFIITTNHGGSINVDSEPGRGTRFTIRLPL